LVWFVLFLFFLCDRLITTNKKKKQNKKQNKTKQTGSVALQCSMNITRVSTIVMNGGVTWSGGLLCVTPSMMVPLVDINVINNGNTIPSLSSVSAITCLPTYTKVVNYTCSLLVADGTTQYILSALTSHTCHVGHCTNC
jgi:hypothetical protein